jgi:nitroreductase
MGCGQPTHTVDVSIACSFMILQACELGLGTCWLGAFDEHETKKILNIPDHVRVVAVIPLGYPNQPPSQKFRKSLNEIVSYEKYE